MNKFTSLAAGIVTKKERRRGHWIVHCGSINGRLKERKNSLNMIEDSAAGVWKGESAFECLKPDAGLSDRERVVEGSDAGSSRFSLILQPDWQILALIALFRELNLGFGLCFVWSIWAESQTYIKVAHFKVKRAPKYGSVKSGSWVRFQDPFTTLKQLHPSSIFYVTRIDLHFMDCTITRPSNLESNYRVLPELHVSLSTWWSKAIA